MNSLLPALAVSDFDRLRRILDNLGAVPPQVLLLEGGTEELRREAALYWACRLNCQQNSESPCLSCPVCRQIVAGEYADLSAFDGRISNREDEENPGLVRAFNMDRVRELKSRLLDAPHGNGLRVVLLMGLGLSRDEAANALLKVLEEPSATAVFVMCTPQREQLLPTLVSRSICLTLPWPDPLTRDEEMRPWEDALAMFLRQGTGLFDRTAAKGAVDVPLATRLLLCTQKALIRLLAHTDAPGGGAGSNGPASLEASLAPLAVRDKATACLWLSEAQEALRYGVTPARVVESLAMRLFALCRQRR